ncbi:MAG: hypothetical protein HQ559_03410 [Lentisphaerae bacterium]|nr:hypothetical protein [Lentisphaerota bacterium]
MKTSTMNIDHRTIRKGPFVVAILVAILVAPLSALAEYSPTNRTDTWTDPGTAGWTSRYSEVELSNPGTILNVRHGSQASPSFSADIAAGGLPVGVMPSNISYRFRSDHVAPSAIRTCFHSSRSGNTWHHSHTPPAPGQQESFALPVDYSTCWIKGPVQTEDEFLDDLRSVDWIGVYIRRHGDIVPQDYEIDDFTVQGMFYLHDDDMDGMENDWEDDHSLNRDDWRDAQIDADGDGMSNFAESRAGTQPRNILSFFRLHVRHKDGGPVPVELKWDSISNRTYRIWRGTSVMEKLDILEEGVESTPFTNIYDDTTATNSTLYIYQVEVE